MNDPMNDGMPPLRRDHEEVARKAVDALRSLANTVSASEEAAVERSVDTLLHNLRAAGIPGWVVPAILSRAMIRILEYSLDVSAKKRAVGMTNADDPPGMSRRGIA